MRERAYNSYGDFAGTDAIPFRDRRMQSERAATDASNPRRRTAGGSLKRRPAEEEMAMQVTYDFSGKSVLLIGGTTGIGRATALAFAKAGANIFVAGVGAKDGESLKKEIAALKTVEVEFSEVDVRDAKAMADLHERAFDRFGRIDVAFNNAGVPGKTAPGAGTR